MKIIALLLSLLCINPLFGQDKKPIVYLTWKHEPTTTMQIQWITSKNDTGDTICYEKEGKWLQVTGSHKRLPQKVPYNLHRIELTGLQPDSLYHFRIGNNEKVYSFKTMPEDLSSPVRFVMGGDAYSDSVKRFRTMTKAAAKTNPRFAVIGGDIAYAALKKKESFTKWKEFFTYWMQDMRSADGCLVPLFVTIGNHEVVGKYFRKPKNAQFYYSFFGKTYYDFSFGKYLHLTFLDSGHTAPIKGKQTKWLKKTLKSHSDFRHRFAVYHVGAYPSTHDFKGPIAKKIRKKWVPLFDKYRLDACFESHDHAYKRTHPLRKGKVHQDGVLYIGDGSWGEKPRKPKHKNYLAKAKAVQQVLVVELTSDSRKLEAIAADGSIIDHVQTCCR